MGAAYPPPIDYIINFVKKQKTMAKGGGSTRTVNSSNASASRTSDSSKIKKEQKKLSGEADTKAYVKSTTRKGVRLH